MADVKRGFAPPPEVTGYFDGKGLKPAFSWLDVWATEHAHAFTVAKATELSVLTAFRDSISRAIHQGKGFERWKEDIGAELTALGWWGPRMVTDPSGVDPERMVDFSRSRRLTVIFHSNMSSARAAGQWERAQRTKRALPYLLYVRTTSADPRPEHLGWVGIILPIDDAFWTTHFPPNGWLCHCSVRQISGRERDRLLTASKGADGTFYVDQAPPVQTRPFANRRTGEVTNVPVGIDPGWQTNAGLARSTTLLQNLESRLAEAPAKAGNAALRELWADPFVKLVPDLPQKTWLPAGVSPRLVDAFADVAPAASPVVSVPIDVITARMEKHDLTMDDFALLPEIIESGVILPDPRGDERVRSIVFQMGKTWWRVFVKLSDTGYLRINSLHQRSEASALAEIGNKTGSEAAGGS